MFRGVETSSYLSMPWDRSDLNEAEGVIMAKLDIYRHLEQAFYILKDEIVEEVEANNKLLVGTFNTLACRYAGCVKTHISDTVDEVIFEIICEDGEEGDFPLALSMSIDISERNYGEWHVFNASSTDKEAFIDAGFPAENIESLE